MSAVEDQPPPVPTLAELAVRAEALAAAIRQHLKALRPDEEAP